MDAGVEIGTGRVNVGVGDEDIEGTKFDCEMDVIDVDSAVGIDEVDITVALSNVVLFNVMLSDVVLDVLVTVGFCWMVLVELGRSELEDDVSEVKVVDDELDEVVDVVLVLEVVD